MNTTEIKEGIQELIKNQDIKTGDYVHVNEGELAVRNHPSPAVELNIYIRFDLEEDPDKIMTLIDFAIEDTF